MNETTLHDLQKKIRNLVHDFGLEYGIPGLVSVSTEANRITVEVKERADGGPVVGGQNYTLGRGDEREMFVPAPSGQIVPNESIYPAELVNHITSHANITLDPSMFDSLKDKSAHAPHLPIEDTLTEREQEDIKRRKDSEHTSDTSRLVTGDLLTTPPDLQSPTPGGIMYDDAPGLVFNSPAEYDNWRAQQKRTRR